MAAHALKIGSSGVLAAALLAVAACGPGDGGADGAPAEAMVLDLSLGDRWLQDQAAAELAPHEMAVADGDGSADLAVADLAESDLVASDLAEPDLAPPDLAPGPDLAWPQHCSNGAKDDDETDIDCGGSCPKCADGRVCQVGGDCSNGERPEISKTGDGRIIPISPHLVELLAGWGVREGWVIPSTRQQGQRHPQARSRDIARAWKRAGIRPEVWTRRPDHAFRKGWKSGMLALGAHPTPSTSFRATRSGWAARALATSIRGRRCRSAKR